MLAVKLFEVQTSDFELGTQSNIDNCNINDRLLTTVKLVSPARMRLLFVQYQSQGWGSFPRPLQYPFSGSTHSNQIQIDRSLLLYFSQRNRPQCVPCICLYFVIWELWCWVLKKQQYSLLAFITQIHAVLWSLFSLVSHTYCIFWLFTARCTSA